MRISDWSSDVCSSDLAHGRAPQSAGKRSVPSDASCRCVRLIIADQSDCAMIIILVCYGHGRSEISATFVGLLCGVQDLGVFHLPLQAAQSPIDFTHPFPAIEIIPIFVAIALASGPAHDFTVLLPSSYIGRAQ